MGAEGREAWPLAAPDGAFERAHGGRLASLRAICVGSFAGRLALPEPAGARPLSVAFPCADHVRELLPARGDAVLLLIGELGVRAAFGIAEGGRLCDKSRCRGDTAELLGEFAGRLFMVGELCAALGVAVCWFIALFAERFAGLFTGLFTGELPTRPAVRLRAFTV